jgi:hypothetical protein
MKISKIFILSLIVFISSAIVLMFFVNRYSSTVATAENNHPKKKAKIYNYAGERIQYLISPLGKSEYSNLGVVDLNGSQVNLVTFKTKVLFFQDTEKIYSDLESLLPLKIERAISKLWGKEFITEEYDQKEFTVTVRKFKGNKIIYEKKTKAKGPIFNAITLPFYLRGRFDLKIGWHFIARVPDEFKLELVSIEKIEIPAGKFLAYHFKSIPDKFEIWINKNNPRVPLKIQGKGFFDYVLLMKKYSFVGPTTQD